MTRSPASIIAKSPIAWPTRRRRRFLSLFVSNAFLRGSRGRSARPAGGTTVAETSSIARILADGDGPLAPTSAEWLFSLGPPPSYTPGAGRPRRTRQGDFGADDCDRQSQRRQRQNHSCDKRGRLARWETPARRARGRGSTALRFAVVAQAATAFSGHRRPGR